MLNSTSDSDLLKFFFIYDFYLGIPLCYLSWQTVIVHCQVQIVNPFIICIAVGHFGYSPLAPKKKSLQFHCILLIFGEGYSLCYSKYIPQFWEISRHGEYILIQLSAKLMFHLNDKSVYSKKDTRVLVLIKISIKNLE